MLTHAFDLLTGGWRYTLGLRALLRETITAEEAIASVSDQLRRREENFLHVLEHGVYRQSRSPYLRLLRHAGFEFDQVKALVQECGLEGALSRLHDAGVYVTLDEFKGRAPVRRPGLEFPVTAGDFSNPLSASHFTGTTGGSRGDGTRIDIDFGLVAQDGENLLCGLEASGIANRPIYSWRPMPPSVYGLKLVFRLAHLGRTPAKWFAPNRPAWNRQGLESRALIALTLFAGRLFGRALPRPVYAPGPEDIVRALAEASNSGAPAVFYCTQSQAVRICLAAEQAGADIRGTVFLSSGEPFTEGKASVLERVGTKAAPQYGMSEAGIVCLPCGAASEPDDMHLMNHKLALLLRPRRLAPDLEVNGFTYTSLQTTSSTLMLNVESGDYGVVEDRDCGCLWAHLGFTTHVHHVRSYEKLTSEGVMFMGSVLYELLEETLPARFGGSPTDYQLVEEEEDGISRVSLIVSPRVGAADESALLDTFYDKLRFAEWIRRQADSWRENGTLRVQRREPYATKVGKILPLHVMSGGSEGASLASRTEQGDTVLQ
jgi:hypothetical protein